MSKKKQDKVWFVRAYCSTCHKLLMESAPQTKKELLKRWDSAVVGAAGIECKDCNHHIPNFYIDLKIYQSACKCEYDPKTIIPQPKYDITDAFKIPEELLKGSK